MTEVLIDNWSSVSNNWYGRYRDPYQHEFTDMTIGNCLHGKVYGHPLIEDGHRVHTSIIKKIEGDIVTTQTGTLYRLGEINPCYLK